MNYKRVYITASATPGLLKICRLSFPNFIDLQTVHILAVTALATGEGPGLGGLLWGVGGHDPGQGGVLGAADTHESRL